MPVSLCHFMILFHDVILAQIRDNGQCCDGFLIIRRVKQDYMLAPMLDSVIFSAMFSDNFNEDENGIKVSYHKKGCKLRNKVEAEFVGS